MYKIGDVYLYLNQNDTNIDDLNLNAVWVEIDRGIFLISSLSPIK